MSVLLETTRGDVVVDVAAARAPLCAASFCALAELGRYDGALFHGVQRGFVARCGERDAASGEAALFGGARRHCSAYGVLRGDPDRCRCVEDEAGLSHAAKYSVAFDKTEAGGNAANFYITLREGLDYLDEGATVFGVVAEGGDIVDSLGELPIDAEGRPRVNVRVLRAHVLERAPLAEQPDRDALERLLRERGSERERARAAATAADARGRADFDGRLEDGFVPKAGGEGLDAEALRKKEARSHVEVLEMLGDLPTADARPPENALFVCKLNPVTRDEDLEIIFGRFGPVSSCEVVRDAATGDSLCYAFVWYQERSAAEVRASAAERVLRARKAQNATALAR